MSGKGKGEYMSAASADVLLLVRCMPRLVCGHIAGRGPRFDESSGVVVLNALLLPPLRAGGRGKAAAKKSGKSTSKSAKAGLQFPVARIGR